MPLRQPIIPYIDYHDMSMRAKDVDPSILCLKYIADRFELNISQRYWLSFLYGTNYCATTTFLMYNEFPDFELVDVGRLQRWWEKHKSGLIFQTDRLRIKSNDQFVEAFNSYKILTQGNQQNYFLQAKSEDQAYKKVTDIQYFGRFSAFNYLDALNTITDFRIKPTYLNMIEADSCRKGLCYAINKDEWAVEELTQVIAKTCHMEFVGFLAQDIGNVFQIETTLCAYHKYRKGQRYIGYYIERMRKEIEKMEKIYYGVAWETLWQFRSETFDKQYLNEK